MVREEQSPQTPAGDIRVVLEQARQGCDQAEAQVLELCRGYLLAVASRDIESDLRPKVAASDAVQTTLMEAQQALATFRGTTEAELLSWLRAILLNNLRDVRRKYFESQKRQLAREQVVGESAVSPGQRTPSEIIGADEEAVRLQAAMSRLPDDYRRAIELRNWQLLSFDEVGVHLGRSAEAARKLWSRAIRVLQQELQGKGT